MMYFFSVAYLYFFAVVFSFGQTMDSSRSKFAPRSCIERGSSSSMKKKHSSSKIRKSKVPKYIESIDDLNPVIYKQSTSSQKKGKTTFDEVYI